MCLHVSRRCTQCLPQIPADAQRNSAFHLRNSARTQQIDLKNGVTSLKSFPWQRIKIDASYMEIYISHPLR
jgi:hypothetical protein